MKKILYPIISMSIILLVIICLCRYYNQNIEVLMDEHILKQSGSTVISMMYETETGSGVYEVSTDSSFSPSGYKYNATLSKCENGSKLEYNVETGKVMMYANMSDKCYVYFDKIQLIKFTINNNEYIAEKDTTWSAFVLSKYNNGDVSVIGDVVYYQVTDSCIAEILTQRPNYVILDNKSYASKCGVGGST